jgi:hypothetical protein
MGPTRWALTARVQPGMGFPKNLGRHLFTNTATRFSISAAL